MKRIEPEDFGKPSLQCACLQMWVLGREFEDSQEYWDGNWIRVVVHCGSAASDVWAQGSILNLIELDAWLSEVSRLHETAQGVAELSCAEPNLWARIDLGKRGHGQLQVRLTQEHMTETHEYTADFDQSYLPGLISSIKAIFAAYPLRGKKT
jgi:hypothetical protein